MLKKDDIRCAVDSLDKDLIDGVNEARYKRQSTMNKSRTIRFRTAVIVVAATLIIAALLFPLIVIINQTPEPVAQLPAASSSAESNTEKQIMPTGVQPNTTTSGDPTRQTDNPTTETPSPTETPVVTPPTEEPTPTTDPYPTVIPPAEIPEWYAPGELIAQTLTREAVQSAPQSTGLYFAAAPAKQALNLKIGDRNGTISVIGARWVNAPGLFENSEHKGHPGLLYDVKTEEIICVSCMLKQKLPADLFADDAYIQIDGMTNERLVSFAVVKANEIQARYLYTPETDALRNVPVLAKLDFDFFGISPDGKYLKTMTEREGGWDAYLIDAKTLEVKEVSYGKPTFHNCFFSPDSKNLLVVLRDENGASNIGSDKVAHLLVNAQTGAHCDVEGMILSYAGDLLVTRRKSTYHVYDRVNCTEIDIPDHTFAWEVRQNNLLRIDVKAGSEETVCKSIGGFQITDDGLYAFGYKTGDEYLTCYSLFENDSFKVDLNDEFAAAVNALCGKYDITYFFSLNDEKTELILCYNTLPKTTVVEDRYTRLRNAMIQALDETDNLIDFICKVEELAPKDIAKLALYAGDGYTHLLFETDYVIVEDYRSGVFTAYSDQYYRHDYARPYSYDDKYCYKPLSSSKEETDAFIASRGWTAENANVDYQSFYVNGSFSYKLTEQYRYTEECLNSIKSFTVYMGSFGYESGRTEELCALLRAFRDCERTEYEYDPDDEGLILANVDYGHFFVIAAMHASGVCTIDGFVVPENVFNDFVSFAFSAYIDNTLRRLWQESCLIGESTPVLSTYENGIKGKAENLTVDKLNGFLTKGLEIGDLAGYNCEVINKAGYKEKSLVDARLLFPVYEDGTLKGFVFYRVGRRSYEESTYYVSEVLLLDNSLHYVADLLRQKLPEGDWTVKNGIELPEYTPVYRQ